MFGHFSTIWINGLMIQELDRICFEFDLDLDASWNIPGQCSISTPPETFDFLTFLGGYK